MCNLKLEFETELELTSNFQLGNRQGTIAHMNVTPIDARQKA